MRNFHFQVQIDSIICNTHIKASLIFEISINYSICIRGKTTSNVWTSTLCDTNLHISSSFLNYSSLFTKFTFDLFPSTFPFFSPSTESSFEIFFWMLWKPCTTANCPLWISESFKAEKRKIPDYRAEYLWAQGKRERALWQITRIASRDVMNSKVLTANKKYERTVSRNKFMPFGFLLSSASVVIMCINN